MLNFGFVFFSKKKKKKKKKRINIAFDLQNWNFWSMLFPAWHAIEMVEHAPFHTHH